MIDDLFINHIAMFLFVAAVDAFLTASYRNRFHPFVFVGLLMAINFGIIRFFGVWQYGTGVPT